MRLIFLALLPSLAGLSATASHAQQLVPTAAFKSVELRGGGDLTIVPGPVQRVTILNGSTQFTSFHVRRDGQLQIDACNARCPHNYSLRIRIESPQVPAVAVKGGGTILASSGFAPQHEVAAGVAGGGTVDLRAIDASTVAAGIDGGGLIMVRPRSTLAAAVSGGGEIRYWGNPAVTTVIKGGGSVTRSKR